MLHEMSLLRPDLFTVAIDCPGYGASKGELLVSSDLSKLENKGDKQAIRSYPGRLLTEVVCGLKKEQCFALYGCSQGGCAIFNAALVWQFFFWN